MRSDRRTRRPLRGAVIGLGAALLLAGAGSAGAQPVRIMSKGIPYPPGANAQSSTSNVPRSSVSTDGQFIAFTSNARNLIAGQTPGNGKSHVFLFDKNTGQLFLVDHDLGDPGLLSKTEANDLSDQPVISADGSFVAFRSKATNLIAGTGPIIFFQIYRWKRADGSITLLSSCTAGAANCYANGDSANPVINTDGKFVAYESRADNLDPLDPNTSSDVFRWGGGFPPNFNELVSESRFPGFPTPTNGPSFRPSISANGRQVAFESLATNLVSITPANDTNLVSDVFVWDETAGPAAGLPTRVILVSSAFPRIVVLGRVVATANGESSHAAVSGNGQWVAFKSLARNTITGAQNDTNNGADIFLWNNNESWLVSQNQGNVNTAANAASDRFTLASDASGVASFVAYESLGTDIIPGQVDAPGSLDVFVFDAASGRTAPGLNVLVSHRAIDPKASTGADSSDPQISGSGPYIAFTSLAKDLALGQVDTSSDPDVFLYSRLPNYSIVASHAAGSTFTVGNGASNTPAISGDGLTVAFQSLASDLVTNDLNGKQDTFVLSGTDEIQFLTVTSTNQQNVIEWVTPPLGYASTRLLVKQGAVCPVTGPADAGATDLTPLVVPNPLAQAKGQFVHGLPLTGPLVNGTTYCYAAFVDRTGTGTIFSAGKRTTGTPFDSTTSKEKWRFQTEAASVAPPGLGPSGVYIPSNDRGLYAVQRGPSGGLWPATWWPLRVLEPIQARPPVVPVSVAGSTNTVFVGDQPFAGGHVYAVDAELGGLAGMGPLWTSADLGDGVQGGIGGHFAMFGGFDLMLAGTRNTSPVPNSLHALNLVDGSPAPSGPFTNGGGATGIGVINAGPTIDYGLGRVYFASRKLSGGSSNTLWCVTLVAGGFLAPCGAQALGDIDGGVTLRGGKVYVGANDGKVYEFDPNLAGPPWIENTSPLGVRGFVALDRSSQDVYAVAGSGVYGFTPPSAGPKPGFPISGLTSPSIPVFTRIGPTPYLYVGSGLGELCQVEIKAVPPHVVTCLMIEAGAQLGAPTFDAFNSMIYLGSTSGVIHAVRVPLP